VITSITDKNTIALFPIFNSTAQGQFLQTEPS
jgi:hypothetical protein